MFLSFADEGRYGDKRVVASEPMLNNSLKWDRKNILHYVRDTAEAKVSIDQLLQDVGMVGKADSGLRVRHLVEMVDMMFKVERFDYSTSKVFLGLKMSLAL